MIQGKGLSQETTMRLLHVLVAAICLPLPAMAAQALCEITIGGERVDGPCRFSPRRGGSFDITMSDGRQMGGATSLSLDIAAPGRGEVRGLTAFGVRSRWGEARRMAEDGACWRGADFTICVRAVDEAARNAGKAADVFVGRCHMESCTWLSQSPAREVGQGSAAVPGRRVEATVLVAQTEHPDGSYPETAPSGLAWSQPQSVQFFCSRKRPAFQAADGSWLVLPLPQVFGATKSVTRQYLRACHPDAGDGDPYEVPASLGYSVGVPPQDEYPDFEALIRG